MTDRDNYVRRALDLFAGYGDVEAFVAVDGRRFSYADLRARVLRTSAALWRHGVRPGMTLMMVVSKGAESYFVQLGAHLLGCRTAFMASINPRVFQDQFIGFVQPDAVIYEVGLGELGRDLALAASGFTRSPGPGDPALILCIGVGGLGPDLTDPPEVTDLPFDPAEISVEPESLFQTSGTTGVAKLVNHGNRFFTAIPKVAEFYRPADGLRIRHLLTGSTWNVGSQSAALMTWCSGGLLVMQAGWDPGAYLDLIAAEQITSSMLSAGLLYSLLDDPRLAGADLTSLRSLTIGASPASPARLTEAIGRFGAALNVVYGMSEIPIITALTNLPEHRDRLASCGLPWSDARVEIRDPDGVALPAGVVGEIWVSGELVMRGYWGQPRLTAAKLIDGQLRTGDVGRLDAEGYLFIVDRISDMIVTRIDGLNIYCRPIEDALAEHPQVRQVAVFGVPDELMGEAIHAYVVLAPGATVTGRELCQLAVDTLDEEWAPAQVEFLDALPTTGTGKVDKLALRARYLTSRD